MSNKSSPSVISEESPVFITGDCLQNIDSFLSKRAGMLLLAATLILIVLASINASTGSEMIRLGKKQLELVSDVKTQQQFFTLHQDDTNRELRVMRQGIWKIVDKINCRDTKSKHQTLPSTTTSTTTTSAAASAHNDSDQEPEYGDDLGSGADI